MSVLAEIFQAQSTASDLTAVNASVADVIAAAAMIGWLSDPDSRWIPLAVQVCTDG